MDDCEKELTNVIDDLIEIGEYDDAKRILNMVKDTFSEYNFYLSVLKNKLEINEIVTIV
jgi:hypothetical protein